MDTEENNAVVLPKYEENIATTIYYINRSIEAYFQAFLLLRTRSRPEKRTVKWSKISIAYCKQFFQSLFQPRKAHYYSTSYRNKPNRSYFLLSELSANLFAEQDCKQKPKQ